MVIGMLIEFFMLFLLGHVLGDFYVQTVSMSKKKEKSLKWVFIHCVCYWVMMLVVCLPILSLEIAIVSSIAAILHAIIDIIKYFCLAAYKKKYEVTSNDPINSNITKDQILKSRLTANNKLSRKSKVAAKSNITSKNGKQSKHKKSINRKGIGSSKDNDSHVSVAQISNSQVSTVHFSNSQVRSSKVTAQIKTDVDRLKELQIIDRNTFFLDQALHIVCLITISFIMFKSNIVVKEWSNVKELFDIAKLSEIKVMTWILALLLIHKPANIAITKLLSIYKPKDKEEVNTEFKLEVYNEIKNNVELNDAVSTDTNERKKAENKDTNYNAGSFVGTVERIIMLIFLFIGQYSAIGLVLTAKSIARYDRITRDPEFAEYYLLGTLLSTLIAILTSFLL